MRDFFETFFPIKLSMALEDSSKESVSFENSFLSSGNLFQHSRGVLSTHRGGLRIWREWPMRWAIGEIINLAPFHWQLATLENNIANCSKLTVLSVPLAWVWWIFWWIFWWSFPSKEKKVCARPQFRWRRAALTPQQSHPMTWCRQQSTFSYKSIRRAVGSKYKTCESPRLFAVSSMGSKRVRRSIFGQRFFKGAREYSLEIAGRTPCNSLSS